MRRFKLVGLTLLAVCAFAAVVASGASGQALLLTLPGDPISGLEYTGTGGETKLEDSAATPKTILCEKTKAAAAFEAKEAKTADSELGTATLEFDGCKKEKVTCRSETSEAEKDPAGVMLVVKVGTIGSASVKDAALRYELVYLISPTVKINCGGVKEELKGAFACNVTPAATEVAAGGTITISCTIDKGKQVAGTCTEPAAACDDLKNNPLLCNFGGGFIACGYLHTESGAFNKMVTYDD